MSVPTNAISRQPNTYNYYNNDNIKIDYDNNNAATKFVCNYFLTNADWNEVPGDPIITNGTTSSTVSLEPHSCIIIEPSALSGIKACTLTLGTKIKSIIAKLIGVNDKNSVNDEVVSHNLGYKSSDQIHIDSRNLIALDGKLPKNNEGDKITRISIKLTEESFEEALSNTVSDPSLTYLFCNAFNVYCSSGGFKTFSQLGENILTGAI